MFVRDHQREQNIMNQIAEAVSHAMRPFDPGRVSAEVVDNLGGRWLNVYIQRFPRKVFTIRVEDLAVLGWPYGFAEQATQVIAQAVADYHTVENHTPPEDHIILGEE